jgi:hypothetical protein
LHASMADRNCIFQTCNFPGQIDASKIGLMSSPLMERRSVRPRTASLSD